MTSWVPIPVDSDFSLQNLPYGVFSTTADPIPRIGVAIGNHVLDLKALAQEQIFSDIKFEASALGETTLNTYAGFGQNVHGEIRGRLQELLAEDSQLHHLLRDNQVRRQKCLLPMKDAIMHLPVTVGDFTDFFVGLHHANNVGSGQCSTGDTGKLTKCKVRRFSEARSRHHPGITELLGCTLGLSRSFVVSRCLRHSYTQAQGPDPCGWKGRLWGLPNPGF